MSTTTPVSSKPAKPPAVQRAEQVSRSLAESARQFRMSKRKRRITGVGSMTMRRNTRAFRIFFVVSFWVVAFLPSVVAGAYFGLIASPQYSAEAKFAVRTGEIPKIDGLSAISGMPMAKIAQDTQVVTNYMKSRTIVEALEQRLKLRDMYSSDDIDWFARFNRNHSIEELVDYWEWMTTIGIQPSSGIVTFTVRAFSAADAQRIADAVIDLSEALVNDMNERMLRAAVADAEREFARSADRLARARVEFQKVRNTEGMLDAGEAGKALSGLITTLQGERLQLQQEYDTQSRYVATTAPQMRVLGARLSALSDQISDLQARMTAQRTTTASDRVLSESLNRFAHQDLERRIAESQYAAAAALLELARATSQRQLVYLAAFVRPSLPQEARYPRPVLYTVCAVAGALVLWGLICAGANAIRNHMA